MRRRRKASLAMLVPLLAVLTFPTGAAAASGSSLSYSNPLRDARSHKPLSCPDPHVIDTRRAGFRYIMVCTTDHEVDGIAIRKSRDLVHWYPVGHVFPRGHLPWWSSTEPGSQGRRFWAPELYRIGNRWVVYFAASLGRKVVPVEPGTMVLGVASSATLRGPWRSRILHYRGQFNSTARIPESFGGTIDPSVVRSRPGGQLYLFWALQRTQIWVGRLSPDGMTLGADVRPVLTPSRPWECPSLCTIEAPEPFYIGGALNLFYSAGSTWDASYLLGFARGTDPIKGAYRKLDQPVLRGGRGFIATGHSSQPLTGPDGKTYVMYQALTAPDPGKISSRRLLMIARVSWKGGRPVINTDGRAE